MNPVTVHRLRQAIDKAVGDGAGKSLIETGTADEYRLTTPTDQLRGKVILAPCFSELVEVGVVSPAVGADLERSVK